MSERVLIGKSSLSIVVDRMVQRGYLRRHVFPEDRRRVILTLTPTGRRLWEKVHPLYLTEVDHIFGTVPAPKRKALIDAMKQIELQLREKLSAKN
jgi:MarR family 2-MHQ and catechol resistance regulon transcriptional repressor